jgi:hypothetical protein
MMTLINEIPNWLYWPLISALWIFSILNAGRIAFTKNGKDR